jgi:photosynthetic reaction center cytochrome c subunit
MRTPLVIAALTVVAIACTQTKPASAPAPAAAPAVAQGQGQPGGPGGPARRRVPPNPYQQDTVRRTTVDSILKSIAGREDEKAGVVFQNVKLLKDMSARDFLALMDAQYGRGLGWTCNNCHVTGNFADDTKKNKKIARQMQVMTNYINNRALSRVKELDADYDKATCAMCHKGSAEPHGDFPVPTLPQRTGG